MIYSEVQYQYMAIDWTQIYKKYKGQWIALKEDEKTVIADGKTAKVVFEKAKKKGFLKPLLFRVPQENLPYFG
ncbi:hypothetical protein A3G67_03935 [Candidatus Roizmanbacteria bacterium RIFCSPLOWO2_12_FULL_40_12]|uniref:DUF5678 domain-containing protein n=1 Tax=Candidatus Roizmanbacteria bacterium RIFCSPLOWO2_01_FULL_40_42 TaxID=1802066 RepID=A0A1F7J5T0_9BACT|nr:MAG: hypothetical protein A2779_03570 [Candidatus Roizmanbacteria bacterium RIFCSPHIGHO2_01_FULL_40_98]OGK28413.1 MAG: hypothetical protein A3C31_00935 [Candidatus Roizmanbacteria bacterium RIFCSPHIGHO2_02_FULL_40_53]OGK30649.1 MAG: hypothetical protein A2W49_03620 [Candidatus Roizmanbacteria bacterium RIFCSPHIGHO2_12_41_18]OGK35977.1 MAG: hypothetical protein A3E69_03305 [Candidatus Roizmanbacteria bacterium RIFCSPHIGHO2_12_FULL_40_130]OGK50969.1 MAG: hypothetical protein A3B50_01705 [Candi